VTGVPNYSSSGFGAGLGLALRFCSCRRTAAQYVGTGQHVFLVFSYIVYKLTSLQVYKLTRSPIGRNVLHCSL